MTITLTDTDASAIASELLLARRRAGSPSMGMVLTLVVDVAEAEADDAMRAAAAASTEHPARVLGVIRGSVRGTDRIAAEIRIGSGATGETVLLRLGGEVAEHAESVVLPLLLPDSPVVIWWPTKSPDDPVADPLGSLAQRRITDAAAAPRGKAAALWTQCEHYADGNTDLAWTRITGWRALLAAALDQFPAKVTAGQVSAERVSPSADLLGAWLADRLKIDVERTTSRGPGITSVSLSTRDGEIAINRPDGRLALFSGPGQPDRPVALKRRETAELLAEELRRLDPDDIYEATVKSLLRMHKRAAESRA